MPPRFVDRLNQEVSDARLVGGRADPQGQWEYGRLEVLINGVWIPLDDQTTADNLGRRGVQVACRTLGYATGAQLLAGADSALPTLSTEGITRIQIECGGGEDTLTDCEVFDRRDDFSYFNPGNAGQIVDDIALVCTNPSGAARSHQLLFFCATFTPTILLYHALARLHVNESRRYTEGHGRNGCSGVHG